MCEPCASASLSPEAGGDPDRSPACPEWIDRVGRLVHAHRARLSAVARREGLPPEDALDAVQEAFVTFLGRPGSCATVEDPVGALRVLSAITRNLARNGRRRHHRAAEHLSGPEHLEPVTDGAAGTDEMMARADDRERLQGCVGQLSFVQRRVVTLRLLEEVAGEEAAAALGLSPGHVAVLLHRAKQQLRTCMG
jgi:RNA polymerase sigma-70 factor (ECF subfamily)